jgi:hypothetical protein
LCSKLSDTPDADKLTPADPSDLAQALAFALRFQGRKRVHNADEIMSQIVANRLVQQEGFERNSGGRSPFIRRPPGLIDEAAVLFA